MTDKLHCPFCGAELEKEMAGDIETGRLVCCTKNCPVVDQNLFPDVWELLTVGKKAQDALLFISNIRGAGMSYQDMFLDAQAIAKYVSGRTKDFVLVGRYTQDELNEITSITKQDIKK